MNVFLTAIGRKKRYDINTFRYIIKYNRIKYTSIYRRKRDGIKFFNFYDCIKYCTYKDMLILLKDYDIEYDDHYLETILLCAIEVLNYDIIKRLIPLIHVNNTIMRTVLETNDIKLVKWYKDYFGVERCMLSYSEHIIGKSINLSTISVFSINKRLFSPVRYKDGYALLRKDVSREHTSYIDIHTYTKNIELYSSLVKSKFFVLTGLRSASIFNYLLN